MFVIGNPANVRSSPDITDNTNILGQLVYATEIAVTGDASEWYRINYGADEGFIHKTLTSGTRPVVTTTTISPATPVTTTTITATTPTVTTTPRPAGTTTVTTTTEVMVTLTVAEQEQEVFRMINLEREKAGVATLIWDDSLARAARGHSEDLRINNMRGHTGSDGSWWVSRAEAAGFPYPHVVGEIIAYSGYRGAVRAWLNSPGHKDLMLDTKAIDIGIGISGNIITAKIGYTF
jgi:uncharacterized protein YkwD